MHLVIKNNPFIEDIFNAMYDWMRVIDLNNNTIYLNRAMSEGLGNPPLGQKCYYAVGNSKPCENCISEKTVIDGLTHEKEEIINGRIFSVMSSPLKNSSGEVIAIIEVLRDITKTRQMQDKIIEQNSKLQENLEMARRIQLSLLPKETPGDTVRISFSYRPCDTLGGDTLDFFRIDRRHTGIMIADVSGHGVLASMLTVYLHSSLNRNTLSPARALKELYREFNKSKLDTEMYITVFYAIYDSRLKRLTFSNAGHHICPIVYGKERFELLCIPGIPISNWAQNPIYKDVSIPFSKGDRLFMCTDGIVELRNKDNEQFGEERLLDSLLGSDKQADGLLDGIVGKALEFASVRSSSELPDDITMAILEPL